MSFLDKALDLATQGFRVFPLKVNSKHPLIDDFPNVATKDKSQITKWWGEANYNIGISTENLVVVDIDNKKGKKGSESVLELEMGGNDFPKTYTQTTPNGGEHLIYKHKESVKQGTDVLASGIDIRSKGGYIVGPGSVFEGKTYKAKIHKVADCPDWIIKVCGAPNIKITKEVDVSGINQDAASKRVIYYLLTDAPTALEGDAGDDTTYKVAASVKDFGVDKQTALDLLIEHWNDRCEPPWGIEELQDKVERAYKYGMNPIGIRSPEADFEPIKDDSGGSYLDNINKKYALIFGDAKHSILEEDIDEKGRPRRIFMQESSFKRVFSPYLVGEGKAKAKTYAEIWLDWPKRRTYRGLCFKPEQEPKNGYYNLWRGFVYKEKPYDQATSQAKLGFDMFIEHTMKNVCDNDQELYDWLISYFAHLIQKPWEKPLTTLVFRGEKGVGKNALVDRIGKLLGSGHYLVAHDSRYLTSNFNGHMDSCLCLVLDEAFWSGDKSAEGKLKGLSTSPEILIERKGKEAYSVDNLIRLIIVGNEDWLVPASSDERRYAVYDVGEGRKQDGKFFETMRILMDQKGGAEVLMHYLKNFELKDINKAPATEALFEQKINSLSAFDQFWYECLQEGSLLGSEFEEKWPERMSKEGFKRLVKLHYQADNVKSWVPSTTSITHSLRKLSPSIISNQKMIKEEGGKKAYRFPSIDVCRKEFGDHMGKDIDWE